MCGLSRTKGNTVLIETYWNVKLCICDISLSVPSRINRNILECKEVTKTKTEAVAAGINRNILECKGRRCCYFNDRIVSINRNILECKGVTPKTVIRSG